MPPPRKRPRLHFLGSLSPDTEYRLEHDRSANDKLLKTKFESVFLKYDRDFEGQADEINLWTGMVEVDNGHLAGIRGGCTGREVEVKEEVDNDEQDDAGYGSRLLRAVTEGLDTKLVRAIGADDVLDSVETLAESRLLESNQSEDDLFDIGLSRSQFAFEARHLDHRRRENFVAHPPTAQDRSSTRDSESVQHLPSHQTTRRSPSVDSLFGLAQPSNLYTSTPSHPDEALTPHNDADVVSRIYMPTPQDLLEQYKPLIRQQIQEALDEQKQMAELDIEPAWRLPRLPALHNQKGALSQNTQLCAQDKSRFKEQSMTTKLARFRRTVDESDEDVWARPRPRRRRRNTHGMRADRIQRRLRFDSEDPLQDGFSSEVEEIDASLFAKTARLDAVDSADVSSGAIGVPEEIPRSQSQSKPRTISTTSRSQPRTPTCFMQRRRGRPPKVLVRDFKILVQLYEGAGLSLYEIAQIGPFSQDKDADQLEDEYARNRSVEDYDDVVWRQPELDTVQEMCESADTTIGMLQRKLGDKSYMDIGDRVAAMALAEIRDMSKLDILKCIGTSHGTVVEA